MKVFSIILLAAAVICSVQGRSLDGSNQPDAEQFKIHEKDEWPAVVENVFRVQDFIKNVIKDNDYIPSEETLNDLRIAGPETHPDLETNLPPVRVVTIEGQPESIILED